jgi:hypothetical protein
MTNSLDATKLAACRSAPTSEGRAESFAAALKQGIHEAHARKEQEAELTRDPDFLRSLGFRLKGDAPEIDGKVHIVSRRPLRQGDIVTVKIERADAYDLYGTAV